MKKKILSAVAAGAVAVGMIGCGGGGSGSTKTTDTTQPTTVKGIDGYVMNAKVVVKYWNADENKTESVTLQNKDNYYLTVDITTNKPKKGSPDYSLKELNSTVLNNVVSVALQQQSQGTLDDNSVYAPSFFDANNDGKYNSKDGDLFIPVGVELKAPKGFSVVTPATTIIAEKVEAVLNDDKNESNLTAVIDLYTEKMAKALGVSKDTIKHVDPLTLKNSKDEKAKGFYIANAILGKVVEDNKNRLKDVFDNLDVDTPENAAEVIANAATIAKKAGNTNIEKVLKQIKNLIEVSKANLDVLVNANLDLTREESEGGELSIIALEAEEKDFNVTDMSYVVPTKTGYKIEDLDEIYITLDPNEKNISTKTIYFVAQLWKPRERMEQGDKNVSKIAVKVPVEINSTEGEIKAKIPKDAKIVVDGMNVEGTKIVSFEKNLSAMGINNDIVSIPNNDGNITFELKTLIGEIEKNLTGNDEIFGGNNFPERIYNMQIGIVDNGEFTYVDGNKITTPALDKITSVGGAINDSVVSMASFTNLVADIRNGVNYADENKKPNNEVNVTYTNGGSVVNLAGAPTLINSIDETNSSDAGRLVLKNNTSYGVKIAAPTVDTWERNLTVNITSTSAYFKDKNVSGLKTMLKAEVDQELNWSNKRVFDINCSDKSPDKNVTLDIKFTLTDEFDESNTTTLYAVIDRDPELRNETNGFPRYDKDNNNTALVIVKELDGFQTISNEANVTIRGNDNTVKTLKLNGVSEELNISNSDGNVTAQVVRKCNNRCLVLDFNTSIENIKIGEDKNGNNEWNLTIVDVNVSINNGNEYNELEGAGKEIKIIKNYTN